VKSHILLFSVALLLGVCGDDSSPVDHSTNPDAGDNAKKDSGSAPDSAMPADQHACTLTISLIDYKLDPKTVTAESGEITLCATNKGAAPHDLAVRDAAKKTLGKTKTLGPGESDHFTVTLEPATYDIYCTQAGHESLGMKGTLTVE
jgi:plastocyanin